MNRPNEIAPDLTLRQIVTAWPTCAAVLERYPTARWDGRWSLQELLAFTRDCALDEKAIVQTLSETAGVPFVLQMRRTRRSSPMALIFIALAIGLTLGAGWGVALLLQIAFGIDYGAVSAASVQAHGVAQLWGWMALFIFAVGTHLLRQNTTRPAPLWLERVAAACIIAGLAAFFCGLSDRIRAAVPVIDIVASCLLLGAALLFGISISWSLSGAAKSQRRHGFIFLIGWLWIWAATDLWFRVRYAPAPVLPDAARTLLIILPVLGLGTNAIYGFGIRLIPGLLNIGHLRHGFLSVALILHNAGLILFLTHNHAFALLGAAMMVVSAILYLIGMDGLRSKPSRPIYGIDTRGHVLVRVAFFWLVCGLVMILGQQLYPGLPHAYSGAWRHALTVGFITTMILGVGQRVIPIFIKQPLASNRMMLLSAGLIIVGNAGRVTLELATTGGWPWAFRLMGATGVLELTALILFAVNLFLTLQKRWRVYAAGETITPDTRVREVVNAYPEVQQRLCALGITMFDDAQFIAPSMTFGALALAVGHDPHKMLAELEPLQSA